jgi:hypothetical protein
MGCAGSPLVACAQSLYGGGDTLTIWRWQGKASPAKALTMIGRRSFML